MIFPPHETWALAGVAITAIGGIIGAALTAWVQRGKTQVDATSALVDNLQEQVRDLTAEVKDLRSQIHQANKEMHEAKAEAFAIRDLARLQVAMSASYIHQLRAHIDTGQPPPAPPIPDELAGFLSPPKDPAH